MLTYKQLERIAKGSANHRRIQILDLLEKTPELSVSEISIAVKSDIKNVSEHVRKLTLSGLIIKRNQGNNIRHKLTPRGISILQFYRIIE
jgi:DNA-binding transcriptional ArsR family regulator